MPIVVLQMTCGHRWLEFACQHQLGCAILCLSVLMFVHGRFDGYEWLVRMETRIACRKSWQDHHSVQLDSAGAGKILLVPCGAVLPSASTVQPRDAGTWPGVS